MPGDGLTQRQRLFAAALLNSTGLDAACKQVNISRETGRRWRNTPAFQAYWTSLTTETVDQALSIAVQGAVAAAIHLRVLLTDAESTPAVRLAVCKTLLDIAQNTVVLHTQEQRLKQLERDVEDLRAQAEL